MSRKNYLFTSESVSEGHPDKVCDRVSDEIVDLFFREALEQGMDPAQVRVACETFATTNRVVIGGETRGPASVTHAKIEEAARRAIKAIGYEQSGFHWQTCKIEILLHGQSADIAQGVDSGAKKDEGAGDQGIMFGYAAIRPALMPRPVLRPAHPATAGGGPPFGQGKALGPRFKKPGHGSIQEGKPVAPRISWFRTSILTRASLRTTC